MLKQATFISRGRWQRVLIAAACIALASQVNFQIYAPGFILALSALLLPIFLYFNGDLNPLLLSGCIAIASPVFRGILLFIGHSFRLDTILQYVVTDMVFYWCYGLLYYVIYWRRAQRNNSSFFLTIVLCDYLSNLLEISLLTDFSHYSYQLFQILFVAALLRSLVSCLLAFLYHYFTLMMRTESHEQRYYHFIWVASSVKSEVYFMQKSLGDIENVMKNAYLLNQDLQKLDVPKVYQDRALAIARDVHEIKKDYRNVTLGLGDYFCTDQDAPMQLADILKVTVNYIREAIKDKHRNIVIEVHNQVDLVIPNHYYIVTVLSNLIFNSVDAIPADKLNGVIRITVADAGHQVLINVSDNGKGMDAKTQAMIFQPGFTTKFNETTGDVYRGIGLSHVKLIVQEQFDGEITVESQPNHGATFQISLSKPRLIQEAQS